MNSAAFSILLCASTSARLYYILVSSCIQSTGDARRIKRVEGDREIRAFSLCVPSACPSLVGAFSLTWDLKSCSVQFSHSVVSDSLRPRELQHARPPCPSPTSRVHSDSRPSSQWCHPVISSPVVPFSSCPQALPASESFPMSQLFAWGGQSTGVSALASFLPKNFQRTQGWSPSEWIIWISLQSKGLSTVFSNTTV